MDLGNAAKSTGAEWIGRATSPGPRRRRHDPLLPDAGSVLRPARRLRTLHGRARCCAPVTSKLAFLGLIPQKLDGDPAAVPVHRPERPSRRPPSRRWWCRPSATAASTVSDPVLPVRDRRRRRALLPVLRAAARAPRPSERWRSSNSCWCPPRWPRAGRCRSPTTRDTDGIWGAPYEPGLPRPRRPARRTELRPARPLRPRRPSDCGATPAAASRPHGRPRCTPTTPRNSTSSAPCSAPPSAISGTRSADSTAASTPGCPRWWSPRCRTSIPTSTASSTSTPPPRARRC